MSDLLSAIPDTPVGRQLAWWIATLNAGGEGATPADLGRFGPNLHERYQRMFEPETMSEAWRSDLVRIGRTVRIAVEKASPLELVAEVATDKDRRHVLTLVVEPEPPHRLIRFDGERRHDFNLSVREAGPADAATLADIERRCPIVMGETSTWIDRGDEYLASTRLMDDCTIGLASVDGIPAAVSCGAERVVRVGGALKKMITVSHLRVLPEHQRKGLWGAANRVLDKYWDHVDGSNAYISVDNLGMQHGFQGTPNKWPTTVEMAMLDCAALAGPPAGRPATPTDAAANAALLNGFHRGEEFYVPYDAEGFARRLGRAPDLYGWERVWMTDGALVGVWPAGKALSVITETAGVRSVTVRGVVLDYGFLAGAEAEFEALLRAWCGALAPMGIDTLSIFTSPGSPGGDLIRRLARQTDAFFMWTPGIPVPDGAESRGLYTDAVYF